MKKKIILFIILIIVITLGILIFINKSNPKFNFYTKTFKISELFDNSSIEIDNIRITLKKVCLDGMTRESLNDLNLDDVTVNRILDRHKDKKINIFFELETIDGSYLHETLLAYQILDNNNNSLVLEYNFNPDFVKKLHKVLIKRENFKSKDGFFGNRINTNGGFNHYIIQDEGNSLLYSINAHTLMEATEENELDLSKIKLFISNINYKDSNNNLITSNNNVYEFIIEN